MDQKQSAFEKEKVYLDSIDALYDKLAATKDLDKRNSLQRDINRVSIKAAEFAIPNEFDRLVEGLGGTGLNADTWNDFVRYYNSFPSNEIEKLHLNAHLEGTPRKPKRNFKGISKRSFKGNLNNLKQ